MSINWLDENTINGKTPLPKKPDPRDIALGAGLLNYTMQETQYLIIEYLKLKGRLSKDENHLTKGIETTADARKSTFGPLFDKMKHTGIECEKHRNSMEKALDIRNKFIHEQFTKSKNGSLPNYNSYAKSIIASINEMNKFNHYLSNLINESKKKQKKNNQLTNTNQKIDTKKLHKAIREADKLMGREQTYTYSQLGSKLHSLGIESKMYNGKLSKHCDELNLTHNYVHKFDNENNSQISPFIIKVVRL